MNMIEEKKRTEDMQKWIFKIWPLFIVAIIAITCYIVISNPKSIGNGSSTVNSKVYMPEPSEKPITVPNFIQGNKYTSKIGIITSSDIEYDNSAWVIIEVNNETKKIVVSENYIKTHGINDQVKVKMQNGYYYLDD
jgi:hypothetical protein